LYVQRCERLRKQGQNGYSQANNTKRTHRNIRTDTHRLRHLLAHTHIQTHTGTHTHTDIYWHTYTYRHVLAHTHIQTFTGTHTYRHLLAHTHIQTLTGTHTHTYRHLLAHTHIRPTFLQLIPTLKPPNTHRTHTLSHKHATLLLCEVLLPTLLYISYYPPPHRRCANTTQKPC